MPITLHLPAATLEQLKAEAQAQGKDVETVVREAVESRLAHRKQTFAEILKPFYEAVQASGMTEGEVNNLLAGELQAARAERHPSPPQP